jgi:hypothetical protein
MLVKKADLIWFASSAFSFAAIRSTSVFFSVGDFAKNAQEQEAFFDLNK